MAKKSRVSCFSVKKADPASRSGMIEVLQSLAVHCPVNPEVWHPPLVAPSQGKRQNTMVSGDYGFFEMGNIVLGWFENVMLNFRSESAVQPIRGARSYRKDVRPGAGHATVAQEEGGDKNS